MCSETSELKNQPTSLVCRAPAGRWPAAAAPAAAAAAAAGSSLPGDLLSEEGSHFGTIFDLLSLCDDRLGEKAWQMLMMLPTNRALRAGLRKERTAFPGKCVGLAASLSGYLSRMPVKMRA